MLERPSESPSPSTGRGTAEFLRPRLGRTEIDRTVRPSLLDRLTDAEPGVGRDRPVSPEESTAAFRSAVQCDIEWLLNTRRSIVQVPEACREVRRSVHEFGLPDVTGISVGTKEGRDMLRDTLQEALERFEPRLQGAVVRLVDVGDLGAPLVRFQVEGVLQMDPSPVRVVFDTMLEVSKGQYAVQEGAQSTTER